MNNEYRTCILPKINEYYEEIPPVIGSDYLGGQVTQFSPFFKLKKNILINTIKKYPPEVFDKLFKIFEINYESNNSVVYLEQLLSFTICQEICFNKKLSFFVLIREQNKTKFAILDYKLQKIIFELHFLFITSDIYTNIHEFTNNTNYFKKNYCEILIAYCCANSCLIASQIYYIEKILRQLNQDYLWGLERINFYTNVSTLDIINSIKQLIQTLELQDNERLLKDIISLNLLSKPFVKKDFIKIKKILKISPSKIKNLKKELSKDIGVFKNEL